MNFLRKLVSFFVGGLFIFSGLIKLNDPVGTAIKLEEYFEVFSADFASFFHIFIPIALPLAIFLCIFEVVLGVAILVGFKTRFTLLATFGLIVFFSFLTFYSAYFEKVTDCGCFGDAIPLDPWESFIKDVILFVLIVFLLTDYKNLSNSTGKISSLVVGGSTVFSMIIAIYVINYLPLLDFRSYKIGNNIGALMQPQEPCKYEYIMEKNGEIFVFEQYPTDPEYQFKEMKMLNEKACSPKIVDYNVSSVEGEDFTEESLQGKKLVILVHKVSETDFESFKAINQLISDLEKSNPEITSVAFTSDGSNFEEFRHEVQLAIPYYFVDSTVLKAMIRSNPGIMLFENGTVKGKWSHNAVPNTDEIVNAL
ncbi:BT_3928 family protein [Flexithrix dorotheae]|uniref:BT_3928 family protein n=1 Tax=Flexithrix dorotheae TaxID=70993 RepID=UPI000367FC13|nr:BT_3928 family protein [Flexithrix dorotheae]